MDIFFFYRNGHLLVWQSSMPFDELEPADEKSVKKTKKKETVDDDEEEGAAEVQVANEEEQSKQHNSKLFYTRTHRHFLNDAMPKDKDGDTAITKR